MKPYPTIIKYVHNVVKYVVKIYFLVAVNMSTQKKHVKYDTLIDTLCHITD